jgi:hypothetical protein
MAEEPWYVESSQAPRGEYGAIPFRTTAAGDPENRRGVALHRHTNYGDTGLQRRLATGFAILREAPHRVVLVGGDPERGCPKHERVYRHIRWNTEEQTYEMVDETDGWSRPRHEYEELDSVLSALDEVFDDEASFVFAHLIYTVNSPFNVPENPRPVSFGA